MAITGITDIPVLLEMSSNSENGVTLFGVIAPDIVKPQHFSAIQVASKAQDILVLIDLVGFESMGVYGYAKGQVFSIVNRRVAEAARKKKSGRLGVVLTGGSLRLNKSSNDDFVSFLHWRKSNNIWNISSVTAMPLKQDEYPEYFNLISQGHSQNWNYPYPLKPGVSYRPTCSGYVFQFEDGTSFDKYKGLSTEQQMDNVRNVINTPPANGSQQPTWSRTTPDIPTVPSGFFDPSSLGVTQPLGGSSQSNISDIARNLGTTQYTTGLRTKEKNQSRDSILQPSKNFKIMQDAVEDADEKVERIIDYIKKLSEEDMHTVEVDDASTDGDKKEQLDSIRLSDEIVGLFEKVFAHWGRAQGDFTGRALFKQACEMLLDEKLTIQSGVGGSIFDTALELHGASILSFVVESPKIPRVVELEGKKFKSIYEELALASGKLYFLMLDVLLGTGGKLSAVYKESTREGVSVLEVISKNPYMLCALDTRFTIEELDKIAMYSGVDRTTQECVRMRNVAYLHNYMLDPYSKGIEDNTIIRLTELRRNARAGYVISRITHGVVLTDGTFVKQGRIESLRAYFSPSITVNQFQVDQTNWSTKGARVFKGIPGVDIDSLIHDYVSSGLGVQMELNGLDYIADYIFAYKEKFIYERLLELSKTKVRDISDGDMDKCIERFERIKTEEYELEEPFKLEQRQSDAMRLVKNPVMCLTGPAGSGKTTTAEGLVYAAEELLGFDSDEIMFCAPTGKAANRLKEVVKRKTRTINSLFGIGGDVITLRKPDKARKKENISLLVVDESSMPTVNLMYDMLIRIEDDTHIYFLGDVEQLPPIGFGKPFANMLQLLPTIVLNVTKRASATSGISSNSKQIIDDSATVIRDLEERDDFKIMNTTDISQGVRHILNICRYHLGLDQVPNGFQPVGSMGVGVNPDDIQVISPINKYEWGVKELNNRLQDIFNPLKPRETWLSFAKGQNDTIHFRKGDRVIHINANQSGRIRFILNEDGSYTEHVDAGINNGEQGKLINFHRPSKLKFREFDGTERKDLADLFGGQDEQRVYVAVQFKDTDATTGDAYNFVVLYRAEITLDAGYQLNVHSKDLRNLDLAYALTAHKLQGSEAKLVIAIFFQVGHGGFISRNMLYTAVSRGKKAEYLIGDILGRDSVVNKGRKIEQTTKRVTMLDMF